MLTFCLPDQTHEMDVLNFYAEMAAQGDSCIGMGNWQDYPAWLRGMENRHTGTDLPEGYVRENFYLCYAGETLVGI